MEKKNFPSGEGQSYYFQIYTHANSVAKVGLIWIAVAHACDQALSPCCPHLFLLFLLSTFFFNMYGKCHTAALAPMNVCIMETVPVILVRHRGTSILMFSVQELLSPLLAAAWMTSYSCLNDSASCC